MISVTGVGFRWRIVGDMTRWLGGSVVVFTRSAKGPGFEPRSSHNFSPVTFSIKIFRIANKILPKEDERLQNIIQS